MLILINKFVPSNILMRIFLLFILSFAVSVLSAQTILSGVVLGPEGEVPGATVRVLESDVGTVTNSHGEFSLAVDATEDIVLEIRSIGFKPISRKIGKSDLGIPIRIDLTEMTFSMGEVVVTGTMQPTFVAQSPVKIDVVTSTYLNTYLPAAASGLVEGISLVNGVQEVTACGVCFTNSISINGLPGPYTAVLMDGTPIYGNLASVYGLNGIPSMIIDRFEVIKGPSSTLYGSEAVAGVINIITKNPASQPAASIDVMGTTHLESFGNFSFAPKIGKSAGFLGVNYAYINDFDDENGDGFGDNVNLDRVSLFSKWEISRKNGRKFSLAGKYYYEDRRNGIEEYLTDRNYQMLRGSEQVYGESIYTHRLELFGSYEFIQNIKIDFSGSTHRQDSYYGADRYRASQDILFSNLLWNEVLGSHGLTVGLTNRFQVYDDNTIATENNGSSQPDRQYIPGVFVQDEWEWSNKLTVLGGARLDQYENHGVIFSPRLSSKYKLQEWTTLRANFGTGFRIVNLFTEDHAFVTGQREVVILEALKPEESYNFSLNLNHVFTLGNSQGMIDLDAYYTHFANKITPDYDASPDQIIYANTKGFAVSRGIGINLQQELAIPLTYNLGLNLQDVSETEFGETSKIQFAPRWSGVFTANYQFEEANLTLSVTSRFTGPIALPLVYDLDNSGNEVSNPRPTKSAVFGIHTMQVNHVMKNGLSIYGGIQNLFNYTQPWSPLVAFNDPNANPGFSDRFDTSYAYSPIHGRELYLGVRWTTDLR